VGVSKDRQPLAIRCNPRGYAQLGRLIEAERRLHGWTVNELATRSQLSRNTIAKLEAADYVRGPFLRSAIWALVALGFSVTVAQKEGK
jgi:transcriptional regulator with XRE-family HTH domain